MVKTLISMSLAWLLIASCQSGSEGFSSRKPKIGTGALEKKRFGDDTFLCAGLTGPDVARTSDQEGEQQRGGDEPLREAEDDVTIMENNGTDREVFLLADAVSYDGKIKALLATKCVGCHKPGGTPPDVSTYDTAKAAGDDSLRTIEDGSMPTAGPLPDADQAAFRAWVTGGYLKSDAAPSGGGTASKSTPKSGDAKNSSTPANDDLCVAPAGAGNAGSGADGGGKTPAKPSGDATAAKPTYVGGVKALLDSKCNTCHKAGGTPPDLTTYAKAKEEGASSLATIEDDSMPPSKPLPDDQKALFKKWSEAGYPEK